MRAAVIAILLLLTACRSNDAAEHCGLPDAAAPGSPSPDCLAGDPFDPAELAAVLGYLAGPELAGRAPATRGDQLARAFIEERFRCLGLVPGGDGDSYQQSFTSSEEKETANVVAYLPGSDPALAQEIVLVGAHHDHLGLRHGNLFAGANDNASGTTGLLAVAAAAARLPAAPRRTLAFVTFGSEEVALDGSEHFARAGPIDRIVYMVNLDMIGSYHCEAKVHVLGSFPGTAARTILDALVPARPDLVFELGEDSEEGDSDFDPLCRAGVPWAYYFTEDTRCYHRPCDVPARIDYPHLAAIARSAFDLTVALADSDLDLAAHPPISCGR